MAQSNTRREAHSARVRLRVIGGRDRSREAHLRQQVEGMLAQLDTAILCMPEDPSDALCNELERIVTTLRSADQALVVGNVTAGQQLLDLAQARLVRFVAALGPTPDG